ncbi:CAPS2 [Bugula neritina]|uniref:CAPS2 n=1 Tax=Bugula neritina TaxID=10212 RepID=A0A7J7IR00_BUGNE|nr:CAPS2 [Bugula neritina]
MGNCLNNVTAAPQLADDDVIDSTWTSAPYHQLTQEKIDGALSLEARKRREKILDTVMVDQLSRAVVSDPSQDSGRSADLDALYHQPGQARGVIRRLHKSKVKTSGTSTEQLLSQRVRFGARILSRVGSDAIRELTGFFFCAENSLTVYEYKQFGKTAKALPLIHRNSYNHLVGRRRGLPYTLADIRTGNVLHFAAGGQKSLPETARQMKTIPLMICDVDEQTKADLILSGVRPTDEAEVWNKFHELTEEEYKDQVVLRSVQDRVREMIRKRGVRTLTGLSAHFRRSDRTGDGMLDRYELQNALRDFHIQLDQEEFDRVWQVVDLNGDGVLDYSEFIRSFIGTMSEHRKLFVRKAFQKIDPMHKGHVALSQMTKFFNAAKHPWVRSGQTSEVGLTEQFLASWTHCQTAGTVTYPEFEDYYEGISVGVDADEEFVNILRNCWGL